MSLTDDPAPGNRGGAAANPAPRQISKRRRIGKTPGSPANAIWIVKVANARARLAPAPDYNRQVHYRAVCRASAGPARPPPCRNLWTTTDDKMMSPYGALLRCAPGRPRRAKRLSIALVHVSGAWAGTACTLKAGYNQPLRRSCQNIAQQTTAMNPRTKK
jgi:hypothetical protein